MIHHRDIVPIGMGPRSNNRDLEETGLNGQKHLRKAAVKTSDYGEGLLPKPE